jgi:gliding motility-associated-like protein
MSDKEYKELLEAYSEQPPAQVWDAIEMGLRAPWYSNRWIQVAGVCIVAIGLVLLYQNSQNKEARKESHPVLTVKPDADRDQKNVVAENSPNDPGKSNKNPETPQQAGEQTKGNQYPVKTPEEASKHAENKGNAGNNEGQPAVQVPGTNSNNSNTTENNHPPVYAIHPFLKLSESEACLGSMVNIKVSGANDKMVLDFGDGHSMNITTTSLTIPYMFSSPGKYKVTVKHENNVLSTRDISIWEKPVASFSTENSENNQVIFRNNSRSGNTYTWIFGDGGYSKETTLSPLTHMFKSSKKQYPVKLIVANTSTGCSDSFEMIVKNPNYKNYFTQAIPNNVFTPNNDGINDVFEIPQAEMKEWRMIISDAMGNKVFETDQQKNFWNGKVNNTGIECAPGNYRYYIYYMQPDDTEEHQKSGYITLLR